MSSIAAVELSGVKLRLGRFTLGPLNWTVPAGATMGLIGLNGAGKTTTIDTIMGLLRPDSGSVNALGVSHPDRTVEIKRHTAYVSQSLDFSAWPKVTRVLDFIRGFYGDWDNVRCARLLKQFDLGADAETKNLTPGARGRLALVMALARDAKLFLLDEPTANIDPRAYDIFFSELRTVMHRDDQTAVISSHDVESIEQHADHIAILHKGQILVTGSIQDVLDRFRQVDAYVHSDDEAAKRDISLPARNIKADSLNLMARAGDRIRLLFDSATGRLEDFAAHGIEITAETKLSLRELFLVLTKEQENV
jgi:ABC-2 type transport system ATP-binding protein